MVTVAFRSHLDKFEIQFIARAGRSSRSVDEIFKQPPSRLRYASRLAKVRPNRCKSSTLEAL
jgi:hypothetical protein